MNLNRPRNRIVHALRSPIALLTSAGASLGLLSAAGSCGVICGGSSGVIAFLGSVGLGTAATLLPAVKVPLFLGAVALCVGGVASLRRRGRRRGAWVAGGIAAGALSFAAARSFALTDSTRFGAGRAPLGEFSPQTLRVLNEGVYELWPILGRAPTTIEIKNALGLPSAEVVTESFKEIEEIDSVEFFDEEAGILRGYWPFSSQDRGIVVTLEGRRPVFARCAIDALGMSAMYGVPARIVVQTPVTRTTLTIEIDGKHIAEANQGVVVGYKKDDCDNMLFFSSIAEFNEYKAAKAGTDIELYDLRRALDRGVASFGTKRETLRTYYEGKA